MNTFDCACGNTLYFENTKCLACGKETGWCPACRTISGLVPEAEGLYRCANAACGARLAKCANYAAENVCNRCIVVAQAPAVPLLCDCCVYNDTIPDLSVEGNREKWGRLEAAKRRLFYNLDLLGLPHGTAANGFDPPLAFDFKADVIPANQFWRAMGAGERVFTGHEHGKITINIREADSAERESLRVELDEAHRTLIGHFRHEIGHYYWDLLVRGKREADSVRVFGDHEQAYAESLERHATEGAPANWQENFISAYATTHPWEDFAETFAGYLELTSVLNTATHVGIRPAPPDVRRAGLEEMVVAQKRIGITMNEMNRAMGLLDFYPKLLVPPVVEKMRFVQALVRGARQP